MSHYTSFSLVVGIVLLVGIVACQSTTPTTESATATITPFAPWEAYPTLFHDVQMQQVFPNGKTFVDYQPVATVEDINAWYAKRKNEADFNLKAFVEENFAPPRKFKLEIQIADTTSLTDHLEGMWPQLTRSADANMMYPSSLIPLPHPYVIPGEHLREIYYWDSYFIMQGLVVGGKLDLVESMLDNFAYLIDTLGFIPNGNRTYLATRSQPPFFSSMVMLYAEATGIKKAVQYLPQLAKEYSFWMEGADKVNANNPEHKRAVWLEEGVVLNRYMGNGTGPRPESYREDVELAESLSGENQAALFQNLRAACESGWDFSARWFENVHDFGTIRTTRILPVDLNSLMYHLESSLAMLYAEDGQLDKSAELTEKAGKRREAIRKYFWSEEQKFFMDFVLDGHSRSQYHTAAGMYPLYYRLATDRQAKEAVSTLGNTLRKPGGVVSTRLPEGQQWDSPNGWAPLQWISAIGMENYGFSDEAKDLAHDWLLVNEQVFAITHKMMEKYNVTDLSIRAGGDEYPAQDGFGWTNGVALGFIDRYGMPQ